MVHSTLEFLIHNNVGIIQTLFGGLFLLLIFLIVRSFKEEAPAPAPVARYKREDREKIEAPKVEKKPVEMPLEASPLDDLDNLDELVAADEKAAAEALAAATPAPAVAAAPAESAAPGVSAEQKAELEKAMADKEQIIAALKTEMATLQEKSQGATDNTELEKKIKELQDKLAEYEIIEEDIANLSFYKNENAKLKDELQKLKATDLNLDIPEEVRMADPANAVAEAAPEVAPEPVASAPEPKPAPTPSPNLETDAALMEEFEKAVEQKETLEKSMPAASKESALDADILKEFESVVQKELQEDAAAAASQQAAPPVVEAATPVADEIDTTKLMAEVEELANTEVKDDGKEDSEEESKQKLIAEFENFINKAQ